MFLVPLIVSRQNQGDAYWDFTPENLGVEGFRNTSVDIEAAADGSFHVGFGLPGMYRTARGCSSSGSPTSDGFPANLQIYPILFPQLCS